MSLLILGLLTMIFIGLCIVVLGLTNKLKGKSFYHFQEQDGYLQLIYTTCFIAMALCGEFILGYKNLFIYFISFAFIGFSIEFIGDWVWYRFFGRRLYNYTKKDLLGFTSWYVIPFWGAAGIYFYGAWIFLGFKDVNINVNDMIAIWSKYLVISLYIVLVLNGIIEYFLKSTAKGKVLKLTKYLLIFGVVWGGIIGMLLENGSIYLVYYFLFTSITGVLLEGILGRLLKNTFGENFWLYYRFPLFDGATSLLVLPLWPFISLIAFFLFSLFSSI
jgi:hypothetical protein